MVGAFYRPSISAIPVNFPQRKMTRKKACIASLNLKQQVIFNSGFILIIVTFYSETDPLALGSEWFEKPYDINDPETKATIKIFNDEEKFEEYKNKMK